VLCCLGLVAGFVAGPALGGPWVFLAPVAGFGLGLTGDFTLIKHGLHDIHKNTEKWLRRRKQVLSGNVTQESGET